MEIFNSYNKFLAMANNQSQRSNASQIPANRRFDVSGVELQAGALFSIATPTNGGNAAAFYTDGYSKDNPLLIVKGKNSDGTPFEEEVNINDVDPRNASFIEMVALQGYLTDTGKQTSACSFVGTDFTPQNKIDYFTERDYLSPLVESMNTQYKHSNYEAYFRLKNLVDSFIEHIDSRKVIG